MATATTDLVISLSAKKKSGISASLPSAPLGDNNNGLKVSRVEDQVSGATGLID